MTRIRLYVHQDLALKTELSLNKKQEHYLTHVMRCKAGDDLFLFNGRDGEYRAQIDCLKPQLELYVLEQTQPQEVPCDLWLCAAPIKRGRSDWVAEKACELGASRLIPTITQHVQFRRLPLKRWRAHMIEAAEQCGRTSVPEITEGIALDQLLKSWPKERKLLFCDETGGVPLASIAWKLPKRPLAVLIGPEGGFSDDERTALQQKAQAVSLGPRVLRADTAAVAALAMISGGLITT